MKCITLTVDAIIPYKGGIVLIKRKNEPFKDHYALPGGIVEYGETVENALIREVKEETGLDVKPYRLIGVYSDPNRDPRGHFVSVCFIAIPKGGELKASSDAKDVGVFKLDSLPKLAFDHNKMIEDAKPYLVELIES
ncbi:NUDIX domain-containing protein [Archaeoglobus profundus]|uniref:NUDIX hydrolase n=1 Tax=Archaeoglobus profundus (strain DSM 5631 / JCM 9629 / NBRC 100127 / Av18) TaxID=572546 RepID=D2RHU2_ARCPA|nr:NUDIX hydrolase [Archaeoglobus profundus]ADB57867.1 NUDIX hydrolase [Archaeoglobus profundus DSM 5631]